MNTVDLSAAVRVRKARRRSSCMLCRSPIVTGQQISSSDGRDWTHVQCFIADRKERMSIGAVQYSYGEVGHDPPVHVVEGVWQGAKQTTRASAVNVSLCGRRLARRIKEQPGRLALCRECEELMTRNELPLPAVESQNREAMAPQDSLVHDYEGEIVIQLGQMFVDRTHDQQRKEQPPWVAKIARDFSWVTCNLTPIAVSARPDGRFHVMDGQHRFKAALAAGYDSGTPVRVRVWRNLTFRQEAILFVELNAKRHSVKPLDLFKAEVTADAGDARAVDVLLDTYGWKVGSAGVKGNFAAVTTLRRLYGRPGPEVCDKAIAAITLAWDRIPDSAHQNIVKALAAFFSTYREAEVNRLAEVLGRKPPQEILMWTRSKKPWLKSTVAALEELYDSGLRDPKRKLARPRG